MSKKKILALLLCLALIVGVTLPTTLAVSSDTDVPSQPAPEEPVMPVMEDGEIEEPIEPEEPADPENPDEPELPEEPMDPEQGTVCTCDPQPEEGQPHQEDCPLYVPAVTPEASAHIASCSDDCTDALCHCSCHLFDRIMACTTLDEIWDLIDRTPEEDFAVLTEEQNAAIEAKIESLEPAPAPEIVIEQSTDETVQSEFYYPTVDYTYVAPFGDPVTGGNR